MSISRNLYVLFIRPHLKTGLARQRIKFFWFVWGYFGLCTIKSLSMRARLHMLFRFLSIDWNVEHAHRPSEITDVVRILAERRAKANEGMLEAGCFRGGSTAKFSIACKLLGYRLLVFDSFQGVEPRAQEGAGMSYDFSGQYVASQELVENNVARFGERDACTFYAGWFRDTLAYGDVPGPVRVAYIDCDLAKGTEEALMGILPVLSDDGAIFSQDYHIPPVRSLLSDRTLWARFHFPEPHIRRLGANLACLTFARTVSTARV